MLDAELGIGDTNVNKVNKYGTFPCAAFISNKSLVKRSRDLECLTWWGNQEGFLKEVVFK
jgi:hypothetical protein